MNTDSILALVKTGRNSNSARSDHGYIAHAVSGEPGGAEKALCGTRPGISACWSASVAPVVTCPVCIRRMATMAKKGGFYFKSVPVPIDWP